MRHRLITISIAAALAGMAAQSYAGPILHHSAEGITAAAAAETAFQSSLRLYWTEDFEGFDAGYQSDPLYEIDTSVGKFSQESAGSGGICAENTCEGLVVLDDATSPYGGRFATSPSNWLDSNDSQEFLFEPDMSFNATRVGFYITDPNDAGGRFDISLGDTEESVYFDDVFGSSLGNGSVFYLSFFSDQPITGMRILSNNQDDGFGIDDVTIGVPEPGALALFGIGLLGLGGLSRRRARND